MALDTHNALGYTNIYTTSWPSQRDWVSNMKYLTVKSHFPRNKCTGHKLPSVHPPRSLFIDIKAAGFPAPVLLNFWTTVGSINYHRCLCLLIRGTLTHTHTHTLTKLLNVSENRRKTRALTGRHLATRRSLLGKNTMTCYSAVAFNILGCRLLISTLQRSFRCLNLTLWYLRL